MQPLVDAAWLADRLDEVVVADVRWYLDGRSGRDAHVAGHLPGAVFVDVDRDLAGSPSPVAGRHPLPEPEAFAAAMGALGIGDGATVVAYDDAGGATAARLVWMLRVLGEEAALLDGGLAVWPDPLETGAVTPPPAHFTPRPWPPALLATADDVAAASRGARGSWEQTVVLDARAYARYRGDEEPVDPRAGHVPRAVSAAHTGNLDPASGRFLTPEQLRARYRAAGVQAASETIVYCGSGVTACHDLLAIEHAGLGPARLYAGSWSQWSSDPDRPAARGGGAAV
jgi:thiosulfate/3-mercaptopyruvate sulfurtransferase